MVGQHTIYSQTCMNAIRILISNNVRSIQTDFMIGLTPMTVQEYTDFIVIWQSLITEQWSIGVIGTYNGSLAGLQPLRLNVLINSFFCQNPRA